MQVKNGIDLIEISRLQKSLDTFGDRFLNRVYDPSEISLFLKKSPLAQAPFLAKNFAAKEAVSKVLGYGFTNGVRAKDIVILRKYGGPIVVLNGRAKAIAKSQGLSEISLSISDTDILATAVAVAKRS